MENAGRKSKGIQRIVRTKTLDTGTVEYNGIQLKRVNTAIINKNSTTYFRCRNMRTPSKVTGICNFSGRIVNFPHSLEMEILHDHSQNCSFLKLDGVNLNLIKNGINIEEDAERDNAESAKNKLKRPDLGKRKHIKSPGFKTISKREADSIKIKDNDPKSGKRNQKTININHPIRSISIEDDIGNITMAEMEDPRNMALTEVYVHLWSDDTEIQKDNFQTMEESIFFL